MKNLLLTSCVTIFLLGCSQNFQKEDFDPSYRQYNSVLQTYVQGEKVDYKLLKEERSDLDHFILQLAGTHKNQLEKMSHQEQLAFWINAYNGITLRSIIDNYPVKSIQDIGGVWTKTKWHVAEQELTLDDIEHKIIRPTFKDARIHFAVNCASIGCPPLLNQAYTGQTVDSLLGVVSANFIQNKNRHHIDFEKNSIVTTELFSWFWEDFVESYHELQFQNKTDVENALLNFTYTHLDDSLKAEFATDKFWEISFAPYDWSLNDIER